MSQGFKGMSIVPGDEYAFKNVDDPTIRQLEISVPDITTRIHHYEEDINASPEQAPNHPIICTEDAVREYEVHFLQPDLSVVIMHNIAEANAASEETMTGHRVNFEYSGDGSRHLINIIPKDDRRLPELKIYLPEIMEMKSLTVCMFPSSKIVIVGLDNPEVIGKDQDDFLERMDYLTLHELSDETGGDEPEEIQATEEMGECCEIWRKMFDCNPAEESDNPGIMEIIHSDAEEIRNALKEDIREQLIEWLACRQLRKRSPAITLGGFMPVFKEYEFDHVLDWAVEMGIQECPLPQDATSDSVNAYINGIKQRAIAHFHLLNNQYM